MASINLLIAPIQGYSATERAEAISAELFAISRPPQVRQPEDVSSYVFTWITHPQTCQCVLKADTGYIIPVHPDNNLANLVSLFPDLSEAEKTALTGYIQSQSSFAFGAIIPSNATTLTEEEMQQAGWYNETEE